MLKYEVLNHFMVPFEGKVTIDLNRKIISLSVCHELLSNSIHDPRWINTHSHFIRFSNSILTQFSYCNRILKIPPKLTKQANEINRKTPINV